MSLKSKVIGIRVDEPTEQRLQKFEARTRIDTVTMVRAAMESVLDYFESNGSVEMPFATIPLKKWEEVQATKKKKSQQ
jgi:predicted DNA-binding protein